MRDAVHGEGVEPDLFFHDGGNCCIPADFGKPNSKAARATFRPVPFPATLPAPERRQTSAISRRDASEFCKEPFAQRKQRAQGKPGARCTRSLACEIKIAHERSHHRFRRIQPGLPRAMVLTAYFALSPATRLFCHRHLRIWYVKTRLGLRISTRLDASIGASEPHDFTVRGKHRSSACHSSAHGPYRPALPSPDIA